MKKRFKNRYLSHIHQHRESVFTHSLGVLLFFIGVLFLIVAFLYTTPTQIEKSSFLGNIQSGILIAFTNEERQKLQIAELEENEMLNKAATLKAQDMAARNYFAHYSPEGVSPWFWIDQVNYSYERAGENLAVLFTHSKDVVSAWMNSPTHKANIIKEGYTEIGIGTAKGVYKGKETTYIVQLFAKPKESEGIALFEYEKQSETTSGDTPVLGIQIETISLIQLFQKEYLPFTIVMISLMVLSISICAGIFISFMRKKKQSSHL